ncbi:MAG: FAD-binding oxidoreductase [Pseudomonadota bacterium]
MDSSIARALSSLPDPIEPIVDRDSLTHFGQDWTRFWPPSPSAVVQPRTTVEVQALVRWAREHAIGLVPSGGRTGLSGGAVAASGEVVVSFDKLRRVLDLNTTEPSVRVQAGVAVGEVQRVAAEQQLYYPVDWAAADSSQVGGSIATNAGGIRVLRYGMTREWVRGLTVVTGTGDVLELNQGLIKNNAGLDLRHLMIGSEGTLGLITEAELGLTDAPPERSVMLLAFSGLDSIMPAFSEFRQALGLSAFEFFDSACVDALNQHADREFPLQTPADAYAIVEFDDIDGAGQDPALMAFERLMAGGAVLDGAISQSAVQAEELWFWREGISESIASRVPYKNDLSVRISAVPAFLLALNQLVQTHYPQFEVLWFGHIGDGNLHMNVLKPEDWSIERFHQACSTLSPLVFELVAAHRGSLSAEHGVGLLKRDYLDWIRSPAELALMHEIKRSFDPDGILNPGKLYPGA